MLLLRSTGGNISSCGRAPHRRLTAPTPTPTQRQRVSSSSSHPRPIATTAASSSPHQPLEAALEAALAELTPDQRLLPAYDEATSRAKRRCVDAAEALERAAAADSPPPQERSRVLLVGEWDLALAGSGTVVTRTPLVRALSALSRGSDSVGLGRIRQVLSSASPSALASASGGDGDVCCRASNEAELLLGPLLGKWRVAVRGAWRRPRLAMGDGNSGGSSSPTTALLPGALVVDVAFDELLIGPVNGGGGRGHHEEGDGEDKADSDEEDRRALRLPLPRRVRAAARRGSGGGAGGSVEWATTYLGERWRIGRGVRSSNLFVFRRRGGGS
jgi:hypothetical protein